MESLTNEQYNTLGKFQTLEPALQVIKAFTSYGEPDFIKETEEYLTKLATQGLKLVGITEFNLDDIAYWTFQFLDTTTINSDKEPSLERKDERVDLLVYFAYDFTDNDVISGSCQVQDITSNLVQITFAVG
jgi:hypothetical protein